MTSTRLIMQMVSFMSSAKSKGMLALEQHKKALKEIDGRQVEAGWFGTARYANGRSVAENARLQEFGAVIDHPGGTKYIEDAIVDGRYVGTRFVGKEFSGEHKVTGAHQIVIPARPFMRFASMNFQRKRTDIQTRISEKLISGKITATQALEQVGMAMEAEIVNSIKNGKWEPNAKSTIRAKGFDKPLVDTSQMFQTATSKVT